MKILNKILLPFFLLFLGYIPLSSQLATTQEHIVHTDFAIDQEDQDHTHHHGTEDQHHRIRFIENKNQWHSNIKYAGELGGLNYVYLEERALTYKLYDAEQSGELHDLMHASDESDHWVDGHAYKVNFLNALSPEFTGQDKRAGSNNYILGSDPEKWASDVSVFHQITYQDIYQDIALATYTADGNFKYDFIVKAHADPKDIQLKYEGVDNIYLEAGNLVIETSVQTVTELAPYAYQLQDGAQIKVNCQYKLEGTTLSFIFPDDYNRNYPLIIDPTVVGATLTGTVGNQNFGHSATFDNAGNIYTAGISFGTGYPSTIGAFQTNFGGGETDIAVNKYNPDGSDLIFATYIGGSSSEYPHSTIVDFNGQMCIYGISNSTNYPTTANAIQTTRGGSYDIVVTKLNANGSALVGSTFMGGNSVDGRNYSQENANYGDEFRGEIILDAQGNIYVASCSSSSDFPVTANAVQSVLNNGGASLKQDGVLMKLNSDLSTVYWATYLGGKDPDHCLGLRLDDFDNVIATGFAGDADFPMVPGGHQPTWPGGLENGYIVKISADGTTMLNSTFWGTTGDEHSYFIDIDEENQVHIYGTSTGQIPITPDTYSFNAGSNQFLAAFSEDLSSVVYSTVIGNGGSTNDFVPVAFMVDKCNGIYFSGYYARTGLPLTSDAIWTQSNSFYLGVLEPNAKALSFATYYGRSDHVDGGTSRFDKSGTVYQAVCSCASSGGVMNTTSNAWATTQNTSCDVGVFKIDFEIPTVTAAAFASPSTSGCAPFAVNFNYTGQDAESIFWDFGDGNTSTNFNPSNTFLSAGSYTVMQIVDATNTCNEADTAFLQIDVLDGSSTVTNTTFCPGQVDLFLDVTTVNANYVWQDGSTGPTFQTSDIGTFWVDIIIAGCTQRDSFIVESSTALSIDLGPDVTVCDLPSYIIDANTLGAVAYNWQDASDNSSFTATESGIYAVTLIDAAGCEIGDAISVEFGTTPDIDLGPDATLCDGEEIILDASSPDATFSWQDGATSNLYTVTETGTYIVNINNNGCIAVESINVNFEPVPDITFEAIDVACDGDTNGEINPLIQLGGTDFDFVWEDGSMTGDINNLSPGTYFVTITNELGCTTESSATVGSPPPLIYEIAFEDVRCFGDQSGQISFVNFSGGTMPYLFAIDDQLFSADPVFNGLDGGFYAMTIQDAQGCTFRDTIEIYEPEGVFIDAGPDKVINWGEKVRIDGFSSTLDNQSVAWSPIDFLDCTDCLTPFANPTSSSTYVLRVEDITTGCLHLDTMQIRVDKPINVYIANAFSPNGDGQNDIFLIQSDRSVRKVNYLTIFDRWGEVLHRVENFAPNDYRFGWDGRFNGEYMNPQVLVYLTEVEFVDGQVMTFKGDFTLIK